MAEIRRNIKNIYQSITKCQDVNAFVSIIYVGITKPGGQLLKQSLRPLQNASFCTISDRDFWALYIYRFEIVILLRVKAKSLLCYWAVRDLGIGTVNMVKDVLHW